MRARAITLWWLTSSVLLLSPAASFAQDHLVPEEGILNATDDRWNYSKKLRDVLLKDAAQYFTAREICKPAFDPEWVVTVVRECAEKNYEPEHAHRYFVEYAGADKNLWYEEDARTVKVNRSRVSLDDETAEAVTGVWQRMLLRVQYPQKPAKSAVEDSTRLHFSRAMPTWHPGKDDLLGGFEQGYLTTPSITSHGPTTRGLIAIGKALKAYALANPEERDKLRLKIRTAAALLNKELDRARHQESVIGFAKRPCLDSGTGHGFVVGRNVFRPTKLPRSD